RQILADQALGGRQRRVHLRGVVLHDDLDGGAVDAAAGVDDFQGGLDAGLVLLAELGEASGDARDHTDLDGVLRHCDTAENESENRERYDYSLHLPPPADLCCRFASQATRGPSASRLRRRRGCDNALGGVDSLLTWTARPGATVPRGGPKRRAPLGC